MHSSILTIAQYVTDKLTAGLDNPMTYPLDLEAAVPLVFPASVVTLQRLNLQKMYAWFAEHGQLITQIDQPLRELLGAVLINRGNATIFVDDDLSVAERRFTIAHEFSHFMIEHQYPREYGKAVLGESFIDILDGKALITPKAQLAAMRHGISIQPYQHFMHREVNGAITQHRVSQAEHSANLLALELLAPCQIILQRCSSRVMSIMQAEITADLLDTFALPPQIAQDYATQLAAHFSRQSTFRDRFHD